MYTPRSYDWLLGWKLRMPGSYTRDRYDCSDFLEDGRTRNYMQTLRLYK